MKSPSVDPNLDDVLAGTDLEDCLVEPWPPQAWTHIVRDAPGFLWHPNPVLVESAIVVPVVVDGHRIPSPLESIEHDPRFPINPLDIARPQRMVNHFGEPFGASPQGHPNQPPAIFFIADGDNQAGKTTVALRL